VKKTLLLALPLTLPLALTACSDSDTSSSNSTSSTATEKSLKNSCVADYIKKPCSLLSPELVKSAIPDLPADMEKSEIPQLTSCTYEWPGDRTMSVKMMSGTIEAAVPNDVSIKWIKKDVALERFKNSYRTMSEEEKAQASAAMKKAMAEKTKDMSDDKKALVAGLSGSFMNNIKFETIDGIATAAAWGGAGMGGNSLKVLDGSTEFEIVANVSNDAGENKKMAIEIAKKVIASCN
jgi:hypothetical protein